MCSLPLYTAQSASSNCSLLHSLAGDSSSSRDLFHPRQVPAHTCLKSPFIKLSSHDPALTHHRSSAGILADTPLPTCLILQGSCPAGVTALYSWESLLARWCLCPLQSLSQIRLFVTPWTAAHQASLSITYSRSSLKLMSVELVMPSNQLILCHPLLLLPSIFPSIRVFSNELVLHQVTKVLEVQLQHQSFQ